MCKLRYHNQWMSTFGSIALSIEVNQRSNPIEVWHGDTFFNWELSRLVQVILESPVCLRKSDFEYAKWKWFLVCFFEILHFWEGVVCHSSFLMVVIVRRSRCLLWRQENESGTSLLLAVSVSPKNGSWLLLCSQKSATTAATHVTHWCQCVTHCASLFSVHSWHVTHF